MLVRLKKRGPMMRKMHPADVWNDAIVSNAVYFNVVLFLGSGRYATARASSLDEADVLAADLVVQHPNGRKPLIYGVDAGGSSGLVTDVLRMKLRCS